MSQKLRRRPIFYTFALQQKARLLLLTRGEPLYELALERRIFIGWRRIQENITYLASVSLR